MTKLVAPTLALLLVFCGVEAARAQNTPPVQPPPTVEPVPAVESAPAVEPAPVVEPAPAAESAPAVKPAPAVEPTPAAESAPAVEPAGPYRTDAPAPASAPCVRQVRRIAPPPSPRSFRRQWPLAAVGSIAGWFVGDRIVGPKGSPFVILSGSTLGAIAGSHLQARSEGHGNLGRSVLGGMLGALPAGALLMLNGMDTYDEAEAFTRGVAPVLGGSIQAAVTAGATSSSLQPARIQIIECPQVPIVIPASQ